MRIAKEDDLPSILEYLKHDIVNCIYMYIDIVNYGIKTDNMCVWIQEENDGIHFIIMKYYDSLQLYTHKKKYDIIPVKEIIETVQVSMISGRDDIIRQLETVCNDYFSTYGKIFLMDRYHKVKKEIKVELATENDSYEIAKLICMEPSFAIHYTVAVLAEQLAERIRTKTGRSYIIRENGKIIAHSATYAEQNEVAVVSGTIVHPEYRNTDYYLVLSNHMIEQLERESKKAYTFAVSDRMIRYHKIVHTECGRYGKLEKKNKV